MIELEQAMDALMRVSEENVALAAERDRLREALVKLRETIEGQEGECYYTDLIDAALATEAGQS